MNYFHCFFWYEPGFIVEALNCPLLPCVIVSPVGNRNGMIGILKFENPNGAHQFHQSCTYHFELPVYLFIIQYQTYG